MTSTSVVSAVSPARLAAEAGYVALIALLVVRGVIDQDARWFLAALVVSLPTGLAAIVGCYLGYALLKGVGGLVLASTVSDGSDAGWLTVATGIVQVALFIAAAIVNVALLRVIRRNRQAGSR